MAPQVTSTSPAGGAAGVEPGAQLSVAFDEAVDAATVGSDSLFLRNEAGALVPADVTYDAAARTATLRPRSALAWATTYTATVKGGAAGVADIAGNPLAQDRTWSFTTAAPPPGFNGPGEVGTKGSQSSGPGSSTHGSTASAAKRVTVSPRTVRASKNGTVRLRVTCPAGTRSCRVALKLLVGKRTVASKTVTVAAGTTKAVTLALSRTAHRDLLRKRSLHATVVASANGATVRTATLLLASRRH
jgi:hypothetical protein